MRVSYVFILLALFAFFAHHYSICDYQRHWMPASAGMTSLFRTAMRVHRNDINIIYVDSHGALSRQADPKNICVYLRSSVDLS
jgi:hypothetical protein